MKLRSLVTIIPQLILHPKRTMRKILKKTTTYISHYPKLREKLIPFINKHPHFKSQLKSFITDSDQNTTNSIDIIKLMKSSPGHNNHQGIKPIGVHDEMKSPLEKWFY